MIEVISKKVHSDSGNIYIYIMITRTKNKNLILEIAQLQLEYCNHAGISFTRQTDHPFLHAKSWTGE